MVNRDRERLVILQVCIDTAGKYSIDGPLANDEGKFKVGTSWVGDGEPGPTAIAVGAALKTHRDRFKASAVKAYADKAKPKIHLAT
jgi:hypothetical protein